MALNTYDVAKHHIGLKERGTSTLFGFMLDGGYDKQLQREGIGSPDFGGSTDLIGQNPSLARWTQDDFVGGAYRYDWGRDDAMFAECKNFIPSQQSRSLLTVPPLYRKKQFNVTDDTQYVDNPYPNSMFQIAGSIYVAFNHGVYRYITGTDTLDFSNCPYGPVTPAAGGIVQVSYDINDQMLYWLGNAGAPDSRAVLVRTKTDLTTVGVNQVTYKAPTSATGLLAKGFQLQDSLIVVGIGQRLYTADPPENTSTAGLTAKWTRIGRLPGPWIDSVAYNGMTYILCGRNFATHIVAFDGTAILPVASFPFNFEGKTIVQYGGRLFVGGVGTDVNGGQHYGELYEVTGSSVRLVRTFSPEAQRPGATWPKIITDLIVYEGLLWFGEYGQKMIAYDLTTDGFFGASQYQDLADGNIYKAVPGLGRLWAYGHSEGNPTTKSGIFRIAQPADEGSLSSYSGSLTTSDFSFEPGMKKRFSELRILTRYAAITTAEYSTDGGDSWTSLTVNTTTAGVFRHNTAALASIPPTEQIRFRFTMSKGTDVDTFAELVAFTVSFAFLDSGKRGWTFVVNGSELIEGRDGLDVAQDVGDYAGQLWTWAQAKTPLTFRDLDGTDADVSITGFGEHQPVIGPNIPGENRPEAKYSVTLLEV